MNSQLPPARNKIQFVWWGWRDRCGWGRWEYMPADIRAEYASEGMEDADRKLLFFTGYCFDVFEVRIMNNYLYAKKDREHG